MTAMHLNRETFEETQRFRQPWLWLLLGILWLMVPGIFGVGIHQQLVKGQPFGNAPMSDAVLVISFLLTFILLTAIVLLFLKARLCCRVDRAGIRFRFPPFQRSETLIHWSRVSDIRIVSYHPIRQFGGWGIRYGKTGTAYTISGKKALQITLDSGERILIGTRREEELKAALYRLKPDAAEQ